MINPLMMMDAMRRGMNPMQFAQQMAMQDPRAQQAVNLLQGKTPEQVEQLARNMCREKGVDADEMLRRMTGGY